MMAFLVDDLLDFAQLNAGKFRKVIKQFELKDSIEEVIDIQKEKAHMGGIKLSCCFKPQIDEDNLVSLFNKRSAPKKLSGKQDSN
jgi:signal transduction histidine kinase